MAFGALASNVLLNLSGRTCESVGETYADDVSVTMVAGHVAKRGREADIEAMLTDATSVCDIISSGRKRPRFTFSDIF